MVHEPVGDASLVGDVGHAAGVKALAREHAHRRVEDHAPLVDGARVAISERLRSVTRYASGRRFASDGSLRRTSCSSVEVQLGDDRRLGVGRAGEHQPPWIDDQSSARRSGCRRRRSPIWLAAITKHWFSIARARSSTSQ